MKITATTNGLSDFDTYYAAFGALSALRKAAKTASVPYDERRPLQRNAITVLTVHADWPGMFARVMGALVEQSGLKYYRQYEIGPLTDAERLLIGDYGPFFRNLKPEPETPPAPAAIYDFLRWCEKNGYHLIETHETGRAQMGEAQMEGGFTWVILDDTDGDGSDLDRMWYDYAHKKG